VSGRLAPTGLWWKYGRIQWVLTLGLIPLSLWFFQECSCISIMANAMAIPWVGFLVVPLIFIGMFILLFSAKYGGYILLWADKLLAILWKFLTYLSSLSWAVWYHTIPNVSMLLLACISVIVLLIPAGLAGRWFGLLGLIIIVLYQPLRPMFGEVWLTLLDVGQGLSAVIQTQNHIAVFDAGPRLSDDFDMGESVVIPFLHTLQVKKIDMMVISHGDNDHSGGAHAIIQHFPVLAIKTSSPELFPQADYCLQHQSWQWDGVNFTFLYPTKDQLGLDNDSSCVLKIFTPYHSVLLPGDIEKLSEKYLVAEVKQGLKTDILVAPHHGSKTSAAKDFIQAVHPNIVLFPVGYRNRYHFPHPTVLNKYAQLGAGTYDTVKDGAIQFKLTKDSKLVPMLYRPSNAFYWNFD
jgi:competence protein ComEC